MEHSAWLQERCRVCGGRLERYKVSYDCHLAQNKLKLRAIGITTENDKKDVHPKCFCHSCYNISTRAATAHTSGRDYTPRLVKFEWVEHSGIGCPVCQKLGEEQRGRKTKKKSTGRPPDHLQSLIATIKERSPPSVLEYTVRERLSQCDASSDLKCPLCQLVLDRPLLLTTCNNLICTTCCIGHLYQHTDLTCPCCSTQHTVDTSTIITAPPVILKLLETMEVHCDECKQPVPAGIYLKSCRNHSYK